MFVDERSSQKNWHEAMFRTTYSTASEAAGAGCLPGGGVGCMDFLSPGVF
jgi:hypothetical protein